MTLIQFLESVSKQNIELTLRNEPGLRHEQLYFLRLEKDDRVLNTCINVAYPIDDTTVINWLCMALEEFEQGYVRKSEYATPINQDLGILGE